MSIVPFIVMHMMQQQEEEERRRRENRRRKREEEERKRKKELERQRRIEEERRKSPLLYNEEEWQRKRCLKVISLNKDVIQLINALQLKRQEIIESESKEIDKQLEKISHSYEAQRKQVESAIEELENLNVKVSGSDYHLSRVGMFNLIGTLDMKTDIFGNVFSPNKKKGIRINEKILSSGNVYKLAYERTRPEETKELYDKVTKKVNKYKKIGKILKFILSREEYIILSRQQEELAENLEYSNEEKSRLDSYNSITAKQLKAIKNYLEQLNKLCSISRVIEKQYEEKNSLNHDISNEIYIRSLDLALNDEEAKPLITKAIEYIQKVCSNDVQVMEEGKKILDENQDKKIENQSLCELLVSNQDSIIEETLNQKKYIKK